MKLDLLENGVSQVSIDLDKDLWKRLEVSAQLNGNSIKDYIENLLDSNCVSLQEAEAEQKMENKTFEQEGY